VTENFLLRRLLTAGTPHERMLNSIDSTLKRRANTSVAEICRYHNISRKHLNFLCKEYLGVSPKMMSSLNRLQNILQQISHSKPESLTGFAYELDYFDQAHFNNSFKQFTGLRPTEYIRNVAIKPSLKIIPHFLPAD
jgi:methylphosphotriester-DNA--protein-cysteine methyltransferase